MNTIDVQLTGLTRVTAEFGGKFIVQGTKTGFLDYLKVNTNFK